MLGLKLYHQVYYTTATTSEAKRINTTNIANTNTIKATKMATDFQLGILFVSKIIFVTPSLDSTETLNAILRSVSSSVSKRLLMSLFSTTLTIATHFMLASHRHAFLLSSLSCSQTHFPSPSLLSYRYLND